MSDVPSSELATKADLREESAALRAWFKEELTALMVFLTARFQGIDTEIAIIKSDVAVLKTDVAVLKTDVAVLKTDVAVLKTDVAGIKTEIAGMKTEMAEMRVDHTREINVAMEEARSWFRVGSDETRAVADRHAALRADHDAHAANPDAHRRRG